MMIKSSILFLAFLSIAISNQIKTEFQIRKRHPKWSTSKPLGKLTVTIFQQQHHIQSEVEAYHSQFLTEHDFQDDNPIIIEFIAIKSNSNEYKNKVYTTSVDEINSDPHGQKIVIVAGFDPLHLSINAINYVQTRNRIGEIYSEVLYSKEEESNIFKYIQAPKKHEQEEEGFFAKYKWPLIIGGVVLYTTMSAGGDPGKQAAAPRT